MYNEGLYSDTYVHSRLTQQELMRRRLMLAACVVLPVLALVVLPGVLKILGLLASVVIDIIIIYFLPNPHIDFEYVFVDGQIDFDRIIAENARKNMCRTDLEKAEVVAPEGSHYLDAFQNLPIQDYSSRNEEDRQYIIVAKGEKGNIKIRFTPDERLLDQMKTKSRSKIKDE
ncbi:MAG: hypothetical protein MR965_08640 [Lachnospiraceae bacterium]|nr:hypothetical protein [Lachnospiraceae bacterium]